MVKVSKLSQYFQKLEGTSSLLEMTATLADLFGSADPSELKMVSYLCLGRLAPLYRSVEFGIANKLMLQILVYAFGAGKEEVEHLFEKYGDLGSAAEELSKSAGGKLSDITVTEVFNRLLEIAGEAGGGSQERKITKFGDLLRSLDPLSVRYITRIPLGKLRLGFGEKTLIDALSWMAVGDKSLRDKIEKVYFIYPDIGEIAERFKKGGLKAISGIRMQVGIPVQAALCQREKTAEAIMARMGGRAAAEYKLDGTRVQLHLDRNQKPEEENNQPPLGLKGYTPPHFLIKTFTRNLEETTPMFPEIIAAAAEQLKATAVILDGEAIGYDPSTGKFLPFQITVQRKRKYGVGEKASEVPLKYFVFDILYLDGKSLLSTPFRERRRILTRVLKRGEVINLTPQQVIDSPEELRHLLEVVIDKGLEGLVVKELNSSYEAGARGYSWIKFKREASSELSDTLDVVVLGYYLGQGKRADFGIGAFLVGVLNEETENFETIAKVGTGLTDEQWREMKRRCDELKVAKKPRNVVASKDLEPDVWISPEMVVEILADEITRSPVHTAGAHAEEPGLALRFPRLIRWRDDKQAEDVTTVKEIERLYQLQFES